MIDNKTQNKAWLTIIAITVLFLMWAITSYAFISSFISEDDNLFETARVKIVLNDGVPIFQESDFDMEPGATIVKDFVIKSESTVPVYYRLYFDNMQGALQEALTLKLYDGEELVYSCDMKKFTKDAPFLSGDILEVGETKVLTAHVTMDAVKGNYYQNTGVSFDIVAQATQSKNNPNMEFE